MPQNQTFQRLFDKFWPDAKQLVVTPKGNHWRADIAWSGQDAESTALARQGPRSDVYHNVDLPTAEEVTDFTLTAIRCPHDRVVFVVYLKEGGHVQEAAVFVKSGGRIVKHTPTSLPRKPFSVLRKRVARSAAKSNTRVASAVRTISEGSPPKGAWGLALVFEDVTSHKFYTLRGRGGGAVTIAWGRVGTQGQSQVVDYAEAVKRLKAKIRKGYKVVGGGLKALSGPVSGPLRLGVVEAAFD